MKPQEFDNDVAGALADGRFNDMFATAEGQSATDTEPEPVAKSVTGDDGGETAGDDAGPQDIDPDADTGVGLEDLSKSLDEMLSFIGEDNAGSRLVELADRLAKGEATEDELAELGALLSKSDDGDDEPVDVREDLAKSFGEDQDIRDAVEVSPFIAGLVDRTTESLGALSKSVAEAHDLQGEFNARLAKSFVAIAKTMESQQELIESQNDLVKSLSEKLETVASTPVGRQSVTTPAEAVLAKGFAGTDGVQSSPASRADVVKGFDTLLEKSSQGESLPTGGEDLAVAVAKFEMTGELSPAMRKALSDHAGVRWG